MCFVSPLSCFLPSLEVQSSNSVTEFQRMEEKGGRELLQEERHEVCCVTVILCFLLSCFLPLEL